jgi:hypothetical protein
MVGFGSKDSEVETSMRDTRIVDSSAMEGGGMEEEEARGERVEEMGRN